MPSLTQSNDLRRNVARGTTSKEKVLLDICVGGQPEIDDDWLHWSLISEHDIFRLDVSVHDPPLVHMRQPWNKAEHALPHLSRGEVPVSFLDPMEQLPTIQQVQDYVNWVAWFVNSLEL